VTGFDFQVFQFQFSDGLKDVGLCWANVYNGPLWKNHLGGAAKEATPAVGIGDSAIIPVCWGPGMTTETVTEMPGPAVEGIPRAEMLRKFLTAQRAGLKKIHRGATIPALLFFTIERHSLLYIPSSEIHSRRPILKGSKMQFKFTVYGDFAPMKTIQKTIQIDDWKTVVFD